MEDTFQWRMTSRYWSGIFQQPLIGSSSPFKLKLRGPNWKLFEMKTTSDGRNNYSGISHQPLMGFSSSFKLKLRGSNKKWILLDIKMTSIWRQHQNIQVDYLRVNKQFKLRQPIIIYYLFPKEEYIIQGCSISLLLSSPSEVLGFCSWSRSWSLFFLISSRAQNRAVTSFCLKEMHSSRGDQEAYQDCSSLQEQELQGYLGVALDQGP